MEPLAALKTVIVNGAREFGDVAPVDLLASFHTLQRWQSRHAARRCLPGVQAMPNDALDAPLLADAYRCVRLATASYGWAGLLWFWLRDKRAGYGYETLAGLLRASARGDRASFAQHAALPPECILFESSSAAVGVPKHFVARDEASRSLVVIIRGSMSLSDLITDALSHTVPFASGAAHEGIAHGARAIYDSTRGLLEAALAGCPPGWGLRVVGHSLGGGTAILFTLLLLHERQAALEAVARAVAVAAGAAAAGAADDARPPPVPFQGVDVTCVAFAPPPVFTPLAAIPPQHAACITSWCHGEDLVPRLSLHSLRELLALLRRISRAHPSLAGRLWGTQSAASAVGAVVSAAHPTWAHTLTGKGHCECHRHQQQQQQQEHAALAAAPAAAPAAAEPPPVPTAVGGSWAPRAQPPPAAARSAPAGATLRASASDDGEAGGAAIDISPLVGAGDGGGAGDEDGSGCGEDDGRFQIPGTIYCYRAPVEPPPSSPRLLSPSSLLATATSPVRALWAGLSSRLSAPPTPTSATASTAGGGDTVDQGSSCRRVRTTAAQRGAAAPAGVDTHDWGDPAAASAAGRSPDWPRSPSGGLAGASASTWGGGALSARPPASDTASGGQEEFCSARSTPHSTPAWAWMSGAAAGPASTPTPPHLELQPAAAASNPSPPPTEPPAAAAIPTTTSQAASRSRRGSRVGELLFAAVSAAITPPLPTSVILERLQQRAHEEQQRDRARSRAGSQASDGGLAEGGCGGGGSGFNSARSVGTQHVAACVPALAVHQLGETPPQEPPRPASVGAPPPLPSGSVGVTRARPADARLDDGTALPPQLAVEARSRADSDVDRALVTRAAPSHLRNITVSDRAWLDHIPDRYCFTLRQLAEVAAQQQQDRLACRGAAGGAVATPGGAAASGSGAGSTGATLHSGLRVDTTAPCAQP